MKLWLSGIGRTRLGLIIFTAAAIWIVGGASAVLHSQSAVVESQDGTGQALRVISSTQPNGMQQIVVVEATGRTMAVYQIDPNQGKIQLKSVRNLTWDLRMDFIGRFVNGTEPVARSALALVAGTHSWRFDQSS